LEYERESDSIARKKDNLIGVITQHLADHRPAKARAHMANEPEPNASGPACYRNRFSGLYKTFNVGEIVIPANEWRFIHQGRCECEGKIATDCQEPGDDGA